VTGQVFAGVRKPSDYEALAALKDPRLRPIILDVDDQASVDAAYEHIVHEIGTLPREVLYRPVSERGRRTVACGTPSCPPPFVAWLSCV
jgi:hypothetical protein